jgi:hypothetical protein
VVKRLPACDSTGTGETQEHIRPEDGGIKFLRNISYVRNIVKLDDPSIQPRTSDLNSVTDNFVSGAKASSGPGPPHLRGF